MEKLKDLDLYLLLGIEHDADVKTIRKAYRKKALKCHPDKNPDNRHAAELFHQLSDALELLCDESARKAYDDVLKARKAAELRNRRLDAKRKKLKEELEAREKTASDEAAAKARSRATEEERLAAEVERLRKEGSRELEEEQRLMREALSREPGPVLDDSGDASRRLKVRWKASKRDETNGGYSAEVLTKFFGKYGEISGMVVSNKKNGSALVEFEEPGDAELAARVEIGLVENPLTCELLKLKETDVKEKTNEVKSSLDFESLVMRNLRQEEERKRLIAEIMAADQ